MLLSVCIICKNEEACIADCISALQHLPVNIVVADTGSTDQTIPILKKKLRRNDLLCHFDWRNDFSSARNFCALQSKTDWIWVVDADEILTSFDNNALLAFINNPKNTEKIGTILRRDAYPLQGEMTFATSRMGRIYNRKFYHYEGIIHEQLTPEGSNSSLPEAEADRFVDLPLSFNHSGYETAEILHGKCKRNIVLLKAAFMQQKDPYTAYQLGQAYSALGQYETAIQYFETGLSFDLDPDLEYVQTMVLSYGYSLLEQKEYQKALSFTGIYNAFAKNADFVFLMGLIYMNNAMFPKAIAEFEKATHFKTCTVDGANSYRAHYNIGVILECTGNIAQAITSYEACGTFAPAKERLRICKKNLS